MFLSPLLFLICCNCPKACLKVNKLQSPKAPCFSSPWKRKYVKSKHNVQEILCKQSAESVWMKKVIIFNYKFQLCNNNPQNSLQSLQRILLLVFIFIFIVDKPSIIGCFRNVTRWVEENVCLLRVKSLVWAYYYKRQPPEVFCKKGVLKNFANFTGKHLCWSIFLIMLQALNPATFLKRESNTEVFLWNLRNF